MTNEEIKEKFEDIFFEDDYVETSRLREPEFYINEASNDGINKFEVLHVKLFGGMNGWGKSEDYLEDLRDIIEMCKNNNIFAYLTKMEIDALDDVFYVDFQLGDLKELNKEKPE